jgi:tRNA threonylcarbamoyladenosine biosynthesis protein TsaB
VASITGNLDNPLILAIETSGRLGSVALAQGDNLLAESHFSGPMRHSAEIFPAITDLLSKFNKKPDQIEHVYISVGPGSFTGLRIAVTIAKTIALARQLARTPIGEVSPAELNSARRTKIVAVDTLDCIAANVLSKSDESDRSDWSDRLAVILDAKRDQFFIAVYEKTQDISPKTQDPIWKKILPDCLMTAEDFIARFSDKPTCGEQSRTIALIGEGLVFYKDKFAHKNIRVLDEKFWNPSAANIHRLGWQLASQGQFADPLTLIPNYIRGPDAIVKQR